MNKKLMGVYIFITAGDRLVDEFNRQLKISTHNRCTGQASEFDIAFLALYREYSKTKAMLGAEKASTEMLKKHHRKQLREAKQRAQE